MFNTVPFNPFPPSSEEKGAGAYELPIAGAETLGGVKVGTGLSINSETGVLSSNIAGAETLGGVKVGTGLSINSETGVLSASSQQWNYSTSEVNTGQKWADGKDIYCTVITLATAIEIEGNSWVEHAAQISGESLVGATMMNSANYAFPCGGGFLNGELEILNIRGSAVSGIDRFIIYYTKVTVQE